MGSTPTRSEAALVHAEVVGTRRLGDGYDDHDDRPVACTIRLHIPSVEPVTLEVEGWKAYWHTREPGLASRGRPSVGVEGGDDRYSVVICHGRGVGGYARPAGRIPAADRWLAYDLAAAIEAALDAAYDAWWPDGSC